MKKWKCRLSNRFRLWCVGVKCLKECWHEELKRLDRHFRHTFRPCSWRHRHWLSYVKWHRPCPCFRDFQTPITRPQIDWKTAVSLFSLPFLWIWPALHAFARGFPFDSVNNYGIGVPSTKSTPDQGLRGSDTCSTDGPASSTLYFSPGWLTHMSKFHSHGETNTAHINCTPLYGIVANRKFCLWYCESLQGESESKLVF